jgi:glycosyltransferase involved in cell wall biosynthesis
MKILFATEYYQPFTPGGTPWSLSLLARELRRRGHEVAVVTPNYGAPSREEIDGVRVYRFRFWRKLALGPSLAPPRDHVNPLFHVLFTRALVSAARSFGADILHAQEKHALVGAFVAGRWLGTPVFLSLRDFGLICPITTCLLSHTRIPHDCGSIKLQRECLGEYLDQYIEGGTWRRLKVRAAAAVLYLDARLKGLLVKRVAGVVGVSQGIVDIYADAGRIARDRAHVGYNLPPRPGDGEPVDPARTRASLGLPAGLIVLYVGKLSPGKGFPVFEAAARAVTERAPGVCFVAAGDGPPLGERGGGPVRRLGVRPHDEVEALYRLADVVVQPAVWPEPFSRVPLEAAAVGKAVVATRVGGMPEAVEDKVTGLLVERSDPAALAHAIEQLLGDPDLRATLGRRAAELMAQRFSPDRLVDGLLAVYRGGTR